MTKETRILALALVAVALSACADSSSIATAAVTDSAGVRIVSNLPGSIEAAEEWSLSSNPVVEIGAEADPDVPLHRVTAVVPLEDGRVAVSANSPARVGGVVSFPFGADTHGATTDDALVLGTAEAPEIRYHTANGALERIVRWPDEDRTFGGPFVADWTEFVDSWLAPMPPMDQEGLRGLLDATPRPERFPAYDDLVAADEGEIWVGAYAGEHTVPYPTRNARVPARRWLVFDTQGALAARVETPEGFLPHAVREGRVWGVYTDDLEVESVRAYEIVRP